MRAQGQGSDTQRKDSRDTRDCSTCGNRNAQVDDARDEDGQQRSSGNGQLRVLQRQQRAQCPSRSCRSTLD